MARSVSAGTEGRIFEVTPDGEIVWEYIYPSSEIFRADRYTNGNKDISVGEPYDTYSIDFTCLRGDFSFCVRGPSGPYLSHS